MSVASHERITDRAGIPMTAVSLDRDELALLQHDLNGSMAVLQGFLGELDDAVDELAELPAPVDARTLGRLLDEDFRPCLTCLGTALDRLRATAARLDATTRAA